MKDNSNISQELLETIEAYYNGSMGNEDRKAFEIRLKEPDFKAQVEDIKNLLLGIETQALKEKLEEFHSDMPIKRPLETKVIKVGFFDFRKIAAAAIIVIACASLWWFSGSSEERLYDHYFFPDPGLPTTMGSAENFEFFDAMVDYKLGHYEIAISKWKKLEAKAPENDTIHYFLGAAYLAQEDAATSIHHFEKTLQTENSAFKKDAYYYLGMAHLKQKHIKEAKRNLQLSDSEHAKSILDELKD